MSQSNDVVQFPIPFTFGDQTYPVPICELKHELEYTAWLEWQARERVARHKAKLGAEYTTHLEIWQNGCDAFKYEFAGRISWESRHSEAGQKHLLWLLMVSLTPAVTPELIDRVFADPDKREELVGYDPPKVIGIYWRSLAKGRPTKQAPAEPGA